jgi:hypothetical protein
MIARIAAIDADCEGEAHAPFNAGMLAALAGAAPGAELVFHAAASHRATVLASLPEALAVRIGGGALAGAGRSGRRRLLDRAMLRFFATSATSPAQRVVVLTATRGAFFALALATRLGLVGRGCAVAIGHSLLADLWEPPRRNPLLRRVDLEHALRAFLSCDHRLAVLEAGIREEFAQRFPDLAAHVLAWPHPLPPGAAPVDARERPPPVGRLPRLGFLGWTGGDKGFGSFLAAARGFAGAAEFHAIGHGAPGDGGATPADLSVLATAPRSAFWPRADYERRAASLDFVAIFHDARIYRVVASGVVMDALALAIPVIAPRIPLVARIAEAHGEIGVLYDDAGGRRAAIAEAIAICGTPRHAAMRRHLAAAAAARTPERLAATIAHDLAWSPGR